MKYLSLALLTFIFSCQSKTEQGKTDSLSVDTVPAVNDTNSPPAEAVPIISTFHLPASIDQFDVFIEANAILSSGASFDSTAVKEIIEFTPATEIQKTETRGPEEAVVCGRYLWYEVKLPNDSTGWVYGAGLEIKSSLNNALAGQTIEINEKIYTLDFLEDTGIGPSDENGLTGCSSYTIPYFYNAEENTMHFIKVSSPLSENANRLFLTTYLSWLSLESSEGGSVHLSSFEVNGNNLVLTANASYQEGGAAGQITISITNGDFELVSIDIEDSAK